MISIFWPLRSRHSAWHCGEVFSGSTFGELKARKNEGFVWLKNLFYQCTRQEIQTVSVSFSQNTDQARSQSKEVAFVFFKLSGPENSDNSSRKAAYQAGRSIQSFWPFAKFRKKNQFVPLTNTLRSIYTYPSSKNHFPCFQKPLNVLISTSLVSIKPSPSQAT